MTYKQKITQIGNSLGIIIPKKLRESLGLELGKEVHVGESAKGNQLIITTEEADISIDPTFFKLLKKVDQKYSKALKELADK